MATRVYWLGHARGVIRNYPRHLEALEEMRSQHGSDDGIRSQNKISRPTESLALMTLPDAQQREMEAVEYAIDEVMKTPHGEDTMFIINYIYWQKRGNLTGAASRLFIDIHTASKYHQEFERSVAEYLGWI